MLRSARASRRPSQPRARAPSNGTTGRTLRFGRPPGREGAALLGRSPTAYSVGPVAAPPLAPRRSSPRLHRGQRPPRTVARGGARSRPYQSRRRAIFRCRRARVPPEKRSRVRAGTGSVRHGSTGHCRRTAFCPTPTLRASSAPPLAADFLLRGSPPCVRSSTRPVLLVGVRPNVVAGVPPRSLLHHFAVDQKVHNARLDSGCHDLSNVRHSH